MEVRGRNYASATTAEGWFPHPVPACGHGMTESQEGLIQPPDADEPAVMPEPTAKAELVILLVPPANLADRIIGMVRRRDK
jgi:hypothetical protein